MEVQIPQGSQFYKKKEKRMNTLLYDYTQKFISKSPPDALIDRQIVIKYDKGGDLNIGIRARIVEKKDGGKFLVIGESGRQRGNHYIINRKEMELIPMTLEELDLIIQELEEKKKEYGEQAACMRELGIDQVTKSSFTAWRILRAFNEEKDQEKLKEKIVDYVSTISEKI